MKIMGVRNSSYNALFSGAFFRWCICILIVSNYITNFYRSILGKLLLVAFKLIAGKTVFNLKEMKGTAELYAKPFVII